MLSLSLNGRNINLGGSPLTGEKMPGDLAGWARLILGETPNAILLDTYDLISQSCVSLYHTYGPAAAAVNKHTDYAVGDGLYFRSQPDYDLLGWTKEYAREWARRFQKLVFYKMTALNLYEKQNAAFRWALAGGDTVTYFVREAGKPLDIVEFPGTEIDAENNGNGYDNNVTLGIKHDKFYRRQGFYNRAGDYTEFEKEGRQQAVQFFLKRAPRQLRGWPLVYSQISAAKNDDRFEDATLAAAILEAMIALVTKTDNPAETKDQIAQQAAALRRGRGPVKAALDAIGRIGNAAKLGAGNVLNIQTGGEVVPLDKKTPSGTYPAFKDWRLKQFGMGANTPPEVMLSQYSTSYTAHRGTLNDFIKTYTWERERFIQAWCRPVLRELATEMILSRELDAPGFFSGGPTVQEAYLKGIYLGPVPGVINPAQEINAKKASVESGFSLRSDEMFNLSGSDYEDVIAEWQEQEKIFREKSPEDKTAAVAEQDEQNAAQPQNQQTPEDRNAAPADQSQQTDEPPAQDQKQEGQNAAV
jgi:capsid protein